MIVLALATWRLSHMLVSERGPFDVCIRIREMTGIEHYSDGKVARVSDTNVLSCVWCTSVWVAIILSVVPAWIRGVLACSAAVIIVEERVIHGNS